MERWDELLGTLERIASALERAAPPPETAPDLSLADCFVFEPPMGLRPVPKVARVPIELLAGIDRARDILLENTRRFAATSTTNPTARALLRVCGTTTTSRIVATASPIGSKTEVPTSLAA